MHDKLFQLFYNNRYNMLIPEFNAKITHPIRTKALATSYSVDLQLTTDKTLLIQYIL